MGSTRRERFWELVSKVRSLVWLVGIIIASAVTLWTQIDGLAPSAIAVLALLAFAAVVCTAAAVKYLIGGPIEGAPERVKTDPRVRHIADARIIAKRVRTLAADLKEPFIDQFAEGTETLAKDVFEQRQLIVQQRKQGMREIKHHQIEARYGEIRAPAKAARDALLGALVVAPPSRRVGSDSYYDHPVNQFMYDYIADDLELLAAAVEERVRRGDPFDA